MPIGSCPHLASVRVAIQPTDEGADDIWITVFTEELRQLLDHYNQSNHGRRVILFQSVEDDISINGSPWYSLQNTI